MTEHLEHNMQDSSLDSFYTLENIGERQRLVLRGFIELCKIQGNASDVEVANYLRVDTNTVRPRRFELIDLKLLGFSEKRICRITGRKVMCWKNLNRQGTSEKCKSVTDNSI